MEFHEKLQELRKQKGLTQEELAASIYVSRTAISKWESGRGYPSIDSLKAIAKFFSVTIDELLTGNEALNIAEEDHKERESHLRDLVFGLLDLSVAMFFFLPFFGQSIDGAVQAVSLLSLNRIGLYLKIVYWGIVIGLVLAGVMTLALQNCQRAIWLRSKYRISLLLNGAGALLCIMSLQPYAATFLCIYFTIKVLMLVKLR
jgi:transcriptional regulator with XRE-family HTH domain